MYSEGALTYDDYVAHKASVKMIGGDCNSGNRNSGNRNSCVRRIANDSIGINCGYICSCKFDLLKGGDNNEMDKRG